MKITRLTATLCLAAGLAFATSLRAQEEEAKPKPPAPSLEAALKMVIPDVDLKAGGRVAEAIDVLREATRANIVMDTNVQQCGFGELRLRTVTLKTALDALMIAADGDISIDYSGAKSGDLITVCVHNKNDASAEMVSRAFRLPDWPEAAFDKNLKDAVSAMKKAVEMSNETQDGKAPLPMPKLEGHRATHLLLVTGARAKTEIIGRVLAALKGEKYDDNDAEDKKGDGNSDQPENKPDGQ